MKSKNNLILVLVISSVLAACGTSSRKAPIEDRSMRQNQSAPGGTTFSRVTDSQSQYVVKKGDTIRRIAQEKGQSYTDLILWNNLSNPDNLNVGQVLRIAPPDSGTSVVANPVGVNVRPLGSAVTTAENATSTPSGNNKNGPRADKRPYSDATFSDLQKSDKSDSAGTVSGKVATFSGEKTTEKPDHTVADNIAWIRPVEGKAATTFDSKSKGIDFHGKPGQNIYAAAAGTVMYAGSGIRGYGNLVIIKHANNFLSAYAHNQAILVKEKQVISKGQKIAEMGNSDSDVVKLHFEIRQQGKPVDPMKFLPGR